MTDTDHIRYSWGGDDHILVEYDEAMSLPANFRVMAITNRLRDEQLDGVIDVCPANASYLVRFDPELVEPHQLQQHLVEIAADVDRARGLSLDTRIIDVPVLYGDPWTHETLMRFRDRHQDPDATDLEFAAAVNGLGSVEDFIEAHSSSPWFTSMVGFVAGLPFLFQMVPRERQLEVPKYLRPRTDTPPLTIGHGGCFACIYSVRGAGGYQMFGITPGPIFDPSQSLPDFGDFMVLFRPGDIVRFRPVTREQYDDLRLTVEEGTFSYRTVPVRFELDEFMADPDPYNNRLVEKLDGDA